MLTCVPCKSRENILVFSGRLFYQLQCSTSQPSASGSKLHTSPKEVGLGDYCVTRRTDVIPDTFNLKKKTSRLHEASFTGAMLSGVWLKAGWDDMFSMICRSDLTSDTWMSHKALRGQQTWCSTWCLFERGMWIPTIEALDFGSWGQRLPSGAFRRTNNLLSTQTRGT